MKISWHLLSLSLLVLLLFCVLPVFPSKSKCHDDVTPETASATCTEVWPAEVKGSESSSTPPLPQYYGEDDEDEDNEDDDGNEYYEDDKEAKEAEKWEKAAEKEAAKVEKKCSPGSLALSKDLLRTIKSEKVTKENAVNDFLKLSRAHLLDYSSVKRVILGNRAADLDSIVSAIAYAYLQFTLNPHEVVLPVLNIRRERFKLRTEAAYVFKKRRIDLDLLIFKDEFDFRWHHEHGLLRLVLVDHNVLPPQESYLDDSVVAVFDHHNDEGKYMNAETRIIEAVGSCATLITREIFETCAHILDRNLARVLLAPIVIDTANFDLSLARPLVSVDEAVAAALLDLIEPHKYPKLQYRSVYFQKLMSAKNNVTSLTSEDLLRRDYKGWITNGYRYGISSVPLSFEKWVKQDGDLSNHFLERMRAKKLDLLVVMLMSFSSTLSRELVIFTDDDDLGETVVHYLALSELDLSLLKGGAGDKPPSAEPEIQAGESAEMVPATAGATVSPPAPPPPSSAEVATPAAVVPRGTAFYIFNQNNTKVSRKSLQPILQKIFQEMTPNPDTLLPPPQPDSSSSA